MLSPHHGCDAPQCVQSLQAKARAGALLFDVIGLQPHTLPDGLATVLAACLDLDPAQRPAAGQLLLRLAAVRATLLPP